MARTRLSTSTRYERTKDDEADMVTDGGVAKREKWLVCDLSLVALINSYKLSV
jgi:hypothetical protein